MSARDSGGPAFPRPAADLGGGDYDDGAVGMTLRDYFAAAAMAAIISKHPRIAQDVDKPDPPDVAATADGAYRYADAMLAERSK